MSLSGIKTSIQKGENVEEQAFKENSQLLCQLQIGLVNISKQI